MRKHLFQVALLLAAAHLARAQAPDVSQTGTLSTATSGTPIFVGAGGGNGAVGWRLTYFVDGVSITAAAMAIQGADAANAAACASASFATITTAGSSTVEVANPSASAAQGNVGLKSYFPCIRATVTGLTGSGGAITYQLIGYKGTFVFPVTATVTPSGTTDVNLIQIKGVSVDSNSGNKSAATQRIVIATDQPAFTTPVPTNETQLNGTTVATNSGTKDAGTQRIVIATDQPALTNAQPENITQMAGSSVFPCLSQLAFNLSGSGDTEIIPLSGSTTIRICHLSFSTTAAEDVKVTRGTGSNCGTGTANVSGLYKAVQSMALDFGPYSPLTGAAAGAICLNQSAAQALGGIVMYDQR